MDIYKSLKIIVFNTKYKIHLAFYLLYDEFYELLLIFYLVAKL